MADHVGALDRALARAGEDVILRRVTGFGPSQTRRDALCRAFIRGYQPHELTASVIQGDTKVTISPSDIEAALWPDGVSVTSTPAGVDPRVPRPGDELVINGLARAVKAAAPLYVAGELVRIDLQVRG